MESLTQVSRTETVLVVSPYGESEALLNRVEDARRLGARILAIHPECSELLGLSHDGLAVGRRASGHEIEVGQHLVTSLAPLQAQGNGPVAPACRRVA
jgi:D-arabinose 5-phosphate isomerase GutQ